MSFEKTFLEIYEVVLENDFEEFHSADVSKATELDSGNIGRALRTVIDEYDIPLTYERESPIDPLCFIVEDAIDYEEIEGLLSFESEPENPKEALLRDVKEKLENEQYSDLELDYLLKNCAAKYYKQSPSQLRKVAETKKTLEEQGVISGDYIRGWRVEAD